ncbi:MAG: hypothetical protein ACK5HO_03710 [Pseudomonadota bacterium]|jgi:hypothetical protein
MEGSGEKKIVFKKGILAPKVGPVDQVAEREAEAAQEREREAAAQQLQYEGEVFDQFYRPLSVKGGEARLREIAAAPPIPQEPPRRRSRQEREEQTAKHQELAEALAQQIYQLAQKQREVDLDLYLSACNVVVADRSPQESKQILDRANDFFTETFYTPIRDRGERPEISHQIIKRVGHQGEDRITRIVKGMDVEQVAETLWGLYHGPHADKDQRIADILLDCTERQVIAVRDEFLRIPYKSLAKQAHAILNAQTPESKATLRKSIGKSEVTEQKRLAAFRARDDVRALRYLFLGRSSDEMSLIKRLYLEIADPDATDAEEGLEAHIRRVFSQADQERLAGVLDGWLPHREAERIHEILFPKAVHDPLDDTLSDPRDSVDRDHTQGIGPFLGHFKKRRMWLNKGTVYHRVINSYELVTERVDALSTERFLATNKALSDMYGYELDARMFASRRIFDPRRAAMMVYERLHVAGDFFEIATPIHFRQPAECLAVQQAFQVVYGESLEEAIKKRLGRVTPNLPEQTREVLIDRYVRGNGRCPLSVDILGRYRGIEPEPGVWQWEYKSLTEDEESAMDIAAIMDQDLELGEFDRPILDFLAGRSYDERSRIERAFYDLTDPNMALREALRNCLSPEAFEMADLLLAGVDLHPLVTAIYTEPQQTEQLGELPPSLVRLVREAFERAHFVALDEFLLQQHPVPEREDEIMDRLSLVLMPEIFAARETLLRVSRTTVDQIDDIRALCRGPLGLVMAFERGFDMLFPRLRVHLKYAASRMAVSAPVFAELILNLEGVDPEVTARILEFFDAVDIHSLLSTLRHYQHEQRVIEEAYDLLNPEAQLRRSIKEMKVDPDLINETLLHLEGYSAKDVALELHELIQSYSGHELGVAMLAVFAIPTPQRPNPRIPEDMNWMDEMAYQVLLAYQHDYGADLMEVARAKGLDTYQLEELTGRVFGIEATSLARELFALLKANKEGGLSQEPTEQRICSYVESRGVRYRSRLVRAYNSFWAHTPGFESLLDDVATSFRDMASKKKLHALLLGVGAEGRSRKVSSIVPIQ